MIFRQGDPQWGNKPLGSSGLQMSGWGCLVTDVAQALNSAGYTDVNPGVLVDKLNSIGGFTRDGLLIWAKVVEAYPQFHYNDQNDGRYNVQFVQGLWGRFNHWVLKSGNSVSDPFYGSSSFPPGFKVTGAIRKASIVPAPKPEEKPEEKKPEKYWVVVTADHVRLRVNPRIPANPRDEVVKKLFTGNELKVDEERNGLLHVWNDERNDYDGWVSKDYTALRK